MHWLSVGLLWLLSSTLAWTCMLGIQLVRHPQGLPDRVVTSAYLAELCLLFSLMASAPLLLLHGARLLLAARGRSFRAWTSLLAALLAAWPAFDQAAFLTTGDGIAGSVYYYPARISLMCGIVGGLVALWHWHLRGLLPHPVGRALARLPRWSRYWVWVLFGVTVLVVLGNTLHYHLRAYAHLARMLLWPTWLLLATLVFHTTRRIPQVGWTAGVLLVALGLHIGAVHLHQPTGLSRARHEVLRRGKAASHADLLVNVRRQGAARFDLSKPERFDCDRPPGPPVAHAVPTPPKKRRNVILLSVDALRRDAVDWKYRNKPLMPNLQRFAERSVDFRRAVTTYPATLMALGGAVTGGSASDILFAPHPIDNIFTRTDAHFDKSFVILPSSRWFRLPVVDQLLLQTAAATRRTGARAQTGAMISKLRRARRRKQTTFAWLHYFEPHAPYETHKGHDGGPGRRGQYRSELSFLDKQLGRLFRFLKKDGWYEDSLVILFSDHGEALGERQYFGHHVYLNSFNSDIPLMLRAPGLAPRVSTQTADITDVAPTVLDFAGVPYADGELSGLSLFAKPALRLGRLTYAEAFPLRGRSLFREARRGIRNVESLRRRVDAVQKGARNYLPKVSVVSPDHRLIVNRVTGVEELYDRRADPHEVDNLSHGGLAAGERLAEALGTWTEVQAERIYCAVRRSQTGSQGGKPAAPTSRAAAATHDAGAIAPPSDRRILGSPGKGKTKGRPK